MNFKIQLCTNTKQFNNYLSGYRAIFFMNKKPDGLLNYKSYANFITIKFRIVFFIFLILFFMISGGLKLNLFFT
ncbi:hypothetical protein T190607A02C_50221 [Tenacibaculum sp. 190524A02b]